MSDFLRRALGEDISLEIVGGGGVWPVEADAAELEAAMLNLAVNARDAMPEGGKLTIETSNSYLDEAIAGSMPTCARPICADRGDRHRRRHAKEVIERAFEPFFTTKQSGQGTGLGLSQVYGFVKQSGGHVKIYSELGEGTTIKIYLPRFFGRARRRRTTTATEPSRGRPANASWWSRTTATCAAYVVETLGARL